MNNIIRKIIPIVLIAFCLVPRASAQTTIQQKKDSLRQVISQTKGTERRKAYTRLANIYMSEVNNPNAIDTIMDIFDAIDLNARQEDDLTTRGVIRVNRLTAYFNRQLDNQVISSAPDMLKFLAEHELWKDYYQACDMLIGSYSRKQDYDTALQTAEKFYNQAKEQQYKPGMGMMMRSLSKIYSTHRRFREAEECIRECISLLQDEKLYLNYLASAYNNLMTNLIGQERYDEAMKVGLETENVNRRYEEASNSPQPSAWLNLWATYVDLYRQTDNFDKAQIYVDKIDSITGGRNKLYKARGHILYGKKQYKEALRMLDKAIENKGKKVSEEEGLKIMTLIKMGETDRAVQLFYDIIKNMNELHNADFNARLDEIKTQYEVDKYIAEKERNRIYFFFALSGCLLLLVILSVTFYYNRVITRKNVGLYKKIKEQDRLAEELAQMRALQKARPESGLPHELPEESAEDRQQKELVDRLHDYLLSDRKFISVDINRNEIVSALGTNKNALSEAVKTVTGKTLMEYIRTIQLEEARRLLDDNPELTNEKLAFDCGFNALTTFYRLFRKQYGITPNEYRKLASTYSDATA